MKVIIALMLAVATCAVESQQAPEGSREAPAKATTMTGVVDQVGSEYVLLRGKHMEDKTYLRAQGFSPDNFARFVGLRVQVEGRISTEGDRRVLVIRNLSSFKQLPPEEE
jgi:hypothetical protein